LLWTRTFGQVADRWIALGAPTYFQSFIVNPVDTNIIYATYADGTAKSTDGGANWTLTPVWTSDNARAIVLNPINRDTLYMGVEALGTGGRGIYRTSNRGNNWTQLYNAKSVRCVVLDPRRPHLLYAGTVTNTYTGATIGFLVSTNTGTTWTESNSGLTNLEIRALAIDPVTTTTLYVGTESGIFKSINSAGSWAPASIGLPAGSIIRALAISPSKPAVIFAGTQGDGLFKSTDGGSSWFASGSGITNGVISSIVFHPTDASTAYVSVQNGAVFRTRDAGSSWSALDLTGVSPFSETVYLTLNPLDPRIIYGLFNSGSTGATIYKRLDPPVTAPTVTTTQAASVTATSAMVNGTVNPNGNATAAFFEWGTSSTLATYTTTSTQSAGSGMTSTSVSAILSGLNPNTSYFFRLVGQNNGGTQRGAILSFTTTIPRSDPNEPNNKAAAATPIAYGFISSGAEIAPAGDVDYYKFTASASDFVAIEVVTADVSELNLRVSLYDATGTEVAGSDIVSTGTERILYGVQRAQQYFIRIVEASDTASFPNQGGGGDVPASLAKKRHEPATNQRAAATPAYTLSLSKGGPIAPLALGAGAGFNGLVPLRWLQPPSNPPIEYRIYRSTSAAGPFGLIGSTWRESFVDTTAANGTLYHYHVRSIYEATNVESGPSNVDKATPRAQGFKIPSRFASVKPTIDGMLRASEWADAQVENIAIRRTSAQPPSVTLLLKNDASTLFVGLIDSNGSASTWNRLVLAFDADNNKTWDKALPSSEGFLVIDDSAGTAIVEYYGVAGTYPNVDFMDVVRNPKGIVARLTRVGSSIHYEISIDLGNIAPVVGASAALGLYVTTISDELSGEYPLQAIVLAPRTFADVVLAKPSAVVALVSPLNASMGISISPTLSWNPFTGATGYRLQVATDSTFASNLAVDQNNITGTSYTATGLATGTVYFWRVMANVTGSAGSWSSTWRFTTYLGPVSLVSPPDKATGVSGSPTLSWNAVKGATSYHIQVSFNSTFAATIGVDQSGITNTSYTASGLRSDTVFYWRVEALNEGGSSGWSSTWSFRTVSSTPSAPTLSSPINGATGQQLSLTLSWNSASGASVYRLQVDKTNTFSAPVVDDTTIASTSRAVSSLSGGTTYYWRVAAKNAAGWGPYSSIFSFATASVVSAPTLSSPPNNATNQATSLSLSWSAAAGATSYHVQVSMSSSFTAPYVLQDSALSATSKQVSGLAENSTYYWRVRGRNAVGYGSWSSTAVFSTAGTKTVTSTAVAFPSNPTASTDYRLVTFPGTSTPTVGQVLTGSQNSNWRMFEENGGTVPNNLDEMSASSTLMLGEGYWLLYKGTFSYSRSTMMAQVASDGACLISVRNGWNIIGNPFDVAVSWASVRQFNSISANLWTYTGTSGFQQSSTLEPFKGYYFFSTSTSLKIPYPFPATNIAEPPAPPIDWRIQLVLETDLSDDAENYIGIAPGARMESDELDQEDPPPSFDQGSLAFVRQSNDGRSNLLSSDFRPSIGDGQVWRFQVSNPKRLAGRIRALGVDELPAGLEIRLIGAGCSEGIDLRSVNEIQLPPSSEKTWFNLVVGTKAFVEQREAELVPKSFELFQNYPNPFNPKTSISYQLPAPSARQTASGLGVGGSAVSLVNLRVFDQLGREVATLVSAEQTAGFYQVNFNAGELPSGIYFYRLEARQASGVFVDTKKLVVIK
jgi:fibronectin type 3 domain-containing protein